MEELKEKLGIDLEEIKAIVSYEENEGEIHNNFELANAKKIDDIKEEKIKKNFTEYADCPADCSWCFSAFVFWVPD